MSRSWTIALTALLAATLTARSLAAPATAPGGALTPALLAGVDGIASDAMTRYHLKSIILRIDVDGRTEYLRAQGDAMSGVPITPAMHFRNGAMAFTTMSTLLLTLVDQHRVALDDPVAKWFPTLPAADKVTLKNLANMTSGYADYVYQPEVLKGVTRDPFRQWSTDELVRIGTSQPLQFEPGTNWGYSHTNFAILGQVLAKVAQTDLASALHASVYAPLGLAQTRAAATPQIPEPVMHAFTSERRADLGIAPGMPFYEESTFWNPSWTTAAGAVETTDINDFIRTITAVGSGALLSPASFQAQVGPNLVGFGRKDPNCPACRTLTADFSYGLGVILLGPWVIQAKAFYGNDGAAGYLASQKTAVAVVMSYDPAAFDDTGAHDNASTAVFTAIAGLLAPGSIAAPGR